MKKVTLIIAILAMALAVFALLGCQKSQYNQKVQYFQTIKASFYELDSTQSIVIRQYDTLNRKVAEQEFNVTSLDFEAEMIVKNEVPSLFVMYLKDKDGKLYNLETRVLR